MALSVRQDFHGPVWPLGLIVVGTPGKPVAISSLVDPLAVNDPNTKTPGTVGANEYAQGRAQQIGFIAGKAGAGGNGLVANSGNIYILRRGGTGSVNRSDYGSMVTFLTPGQNIWIASAPLNRDVFSMYDYLIDADTAGDSCLVSLIIQ